MNNVISAINFPNVLQLAISNPLHLGNINIFRINTSVQKFRIICHLIMTHHLHTKK